MSATEPTAPKAPKAPTARKAQPSGPFALAGVSMRDLLASCAAAEAVSTPPRLPDPSTVRRPVEHPRAA